MRRVLKWILGLAMIAAISAVSLFAWFVLWPSQGIPALEHVDEYVWLDQGWGAGQNSELRERYYYTAQGTSLPQGASDSAMRYDWFVNLELALSQERFAAPEHMRRYRFLVDPEPSPANPDQLPIGFTKHFDPHIGEFVLDITCAACHTGEIHYTRDGRTRAIRIDGGPAMHSFTDLERGNFSPQLVASLLTTIYSPWKFDRFARKVLGPGYPASKPKLKQALLACFQAMVASGKDNQFRQLYPVKEGYGRTDVLGRIGNTAFGDHLDTANYQLINAPVSYPYVWDTWKFDWVQYTGSVAQPLARNVDKALGVGAIAPMQSSMGEPLPPAMRFRSSVDIAGMLRIEHVLQTLRPPRWPENILGGIDQERAARGAVLFKQTCEECHGPHVAEPARQQSNAPLKNILGTEWRIRVIPVDYVGTDRIAAMGFVDRLYDLSSTGLENVELRNAVRPMLIRALARDVRFRLRQFALLHEGEAGKGPLSAAAATWPDPDMDAVPSLPLGRFRELEALLVKTIGSLPEFKAIDEQPRDGFPTCDELCHLRRLVWDLRYGANIEGRLGAMDVKYLPESLALNVVGIFIKNRFYADYGVDYTTQQCIDGFGTLDLPQMIAGYKARPLEGVWATPPFLHNGSVPSLYQMLLPPEQRDRKFFVGRREFDPVHVGFVTTPDAEGDDHGFWLDTNISGNYNTGHAFTADAVNWQKHLEDPRANPLPRGVIGPKFSDDERYALIEYLKVHRDLPETPADYQPPSCRLWGRDL